MDTSNQEEINLVNAQEETNVTATSLKNCVPSLFVCKFIQQLNCSEFFSSNNDDIFYFEYFLSKLPGYLRQNYYSTRSMELRYISC